MAKLQKLKYNPAFFFSIGDTVIRRYNSNEEEFDTTGINYKEPQIIVHEEKCGEINGSPIQLLYFKSNPTKFHNGYEFEAYGETLIELEKMEDELKKRELENKKIKQNKKKNIKVDISKPTIILPLDKLKNKT